MAPLRLPDRPPRRLSCRSARLPSLGQLSRRPHPRPPPSRRATVAPVRTPVRGARGDAYARARSDLRCLSVAPLYLPSMCRLAVARAEQVPAVAEALATMHEGKQTGVCSRFTASILMRCDLDAQLNFYGKVIGEGGAAAIARALASNHTVEWVCVQHRVPAWGRPMWRARSSLTSLAPDARPRLLSLRAARTRSQWDWLSECGDVGGCAHGQPHAEEPLVD